MRKLLLVSAGLIALLYLLPAAFVWRDGAAAEETPQGSAPAARSADTGGTADFSTVTVEIGGTPTELPLEVYVEGVTAAEIPGDFPEQALRAQAVAARTYAVYKLSRGRPEAHPEADLCDDYRHCAAWRDPAEAALSDGSIDRVRQAVADTEGEILTYENAPIAAVFHCASGPRTEAAQDVWGEAVPYLQSVVSPGGSACAQYEGTVRVTADAFRQTVSETFPQADLSGPPADWFKASVRTAAGGIQTVQLGGITVEGTAVRALFGLHSTNFTITTDADSLTFHTIGYGHGVGLSQYGARYLAEQGEDYRQILAHYYPETELAQV